MNKLFMLLYIVLLPFQTACASQPAPNTDSWVSATIIGSAESPDPILQRVQQLQQLGQVKDVIVMESFPVQIRLSAPQQLIEQLRTMPRVTPPSYQ